MIILKTNILYAFLVIGIILGPVYSVYLYIQYSPIYTQYHNEYYQANSNSPFLSENNNSYGTPSGNSFDLVNHTVYSLTDPPVNTSNGHPYGYFKLLEINLSANFDKIESTQVHNITFLAPNLIVGTFHLSQAFFDGFRFWAFYNPFHQYNATYHIFFYSFSKNGVLLSNNTVIVHDAKPPTVDHTLFFVGIFNHHFFLYDRNIDSLLIYSSLTFNLVLSIPLSRFSPMVDFPSNLDHSGLLWFGTPFNSSTIVTTGGLAYSIHPPSYIAFSAQDLLNNQTLNFQKVITFPTVQYYASNLTFGNTQLTDWFVTPDRLFYLQYAFFGLGGVNTVVQGVYVNAISKITLPGFDLFLSFLGYVLCISEAAIIIYSKFPVKM